MNKMYQMYRLPFARDNPKNMLERLHHALTVEAYVIISMEKEKNKPLKVYASLKMNFYNVTDPGVITFPVVCFNTDPAIVCAANDVKEWDKYKVSRHAVADGL